MTALVTPLTSATTATRFWRQRYAPCPESTGSHAPEVGLPGDQAELREIKLVAAAGGILHITVDGDLSGTQLRLLQRAKDLLELQTGWNSHAAASVPGLSVRTLLLMAGNNFTDTTPLPSIIPLTDGGVQMEWHRADIEIEIRIDAGGTAHIWYEDFLNGECDEFSEREEFPRFAQLIADLAQRA